MDSVGVERWDDDNTCIFELFVQVPKKQANIVVGKIENHAAEGNVISAIIHIIRTYFSQFLNWLDPNEQKSDKLWIIN